MPRSVSAVVLLDPAADQRRRWRVVLVLWTLATIAFVTGAALLWWRYAPLATAERAATALLRGDAPELATVADPDSLLGRFFDEWAIAAERDDAIRHPRAFALSVRPEAIAVLRREFDRALGAAAARRPWLFEDAITIVGPAMRYRGFDRHVRFVVRVGDIEGYGWIVLRWTPPRDLTSWAAWHGAAQGWRVVAIRGLVPVVDAALTAQDTARPPISAGARRPTASAR